MCDTCPSHIPRPGEVAGGLVGLGVGAALSKPGRRVLFWGIAVPMLPFAVRGLFGWWTILIAAVLAPRRLRAWCSSGAWPVTPWSSRRRR